MQMDGQNEKKREQEKDRDIESRVGVGGSHEWEAKGTGLVSRPGSCLVAQRLLRARRWPLFALLAAPVGGPGLE